MKQVKKVLNKELVVSSIMIALLGGIIALRSSEMPDMATVMVVVGLLVIYALFAVFVWNERPKDEREELQTLSSSKIAYLVGAAALTLGTVVQIINHELDVWLPTSLALMVLSKALSLHFIKQREE